MLEKQKWKEVRGSDLCVVTLLWTIFTDMIGTKNFRVVSMNDLLGAKKSVGVGRTKPTT